MRGLAASFIRKDSWAVAVVFMLHIAATCRFLPPTQLFRSEPLQYADYAVHTHRVQVYREALWESGLPWGSDPAVAGGYTISPFQDLGAKPQQILAALLPFLTPGLVVRLFTFLVVVTIPIWSILVCRRLRLSGAVQAWILLSLLIPLWLHSYLPVFLYSGMISHVAAGFFAPFLLVLYEDFLARPRFANYLAFSLGAAGLFILHVLGPVAVLPSLVLMVFGVRGLTFRWRLAVLAVPPFVATVNSFWLVPALTARQMPTAPGIFYAFLETERHLTMAGWEDLLKIMDPVGIVTHVGGMLLAAAGLTLLARKGRRRLAISLGVALAFALFLRYFGSFIPVLVRMQCLRFLVPACALAALPIGVALAALLRKLSLPVARCAIAMAVLAAFFAIWQGKPEALPVPPIPDPVRDFIARRTQLEDRLLVQSEDGYRVSGYEAQIFPSAYGREVIGNTFPDQHDAAQFHDISLWGRLISDWQPDQLRKSLDRWGIAWVFTQTDPARELLQAATGKTGEKIGKYHVFHFRETPSRFLTGQGRVEVSVNRLELSDLRPAEGLIVLRYRYHPAWQTDSGIKVYKHPVPEDPKGFIALRNPPRSITLNFSPSAMLRASWPE